MLRFAPDLKASEIVADGFRNAYAMDFNGDGELFTFDSDNERCVSLPWYESTRLYHVIPGGHYGWQAPQRAQWWRMPPYFCDVVAPVATFGRGSPTGVACYRHTQFPEHYRGGLFLLDWTFGKVYFVKLQRAGATYSCQKEVFLESVGDNGFAPTAVVVHPTTGDLFIAIGGRGTRGAVYRIRYPKGMTPLDPARLAGLQPQPRCLDWRPALARDLAKQAEDPDALERLRALLALRRHIDQCEPQAIHQAIIANWDDPSRYVRKAAADLIALLHPSSRQVLTRRVKNPLEQTTFGLATYQSAPEEIISQACRFIAGRETSMEARLVSVRLVQMALGRLTAPRVAGTVWEGYTLRLGTRPDLPEDLLSALRKAFPAGHPDLDRELARTLAMLEDGDPATLGKVIERFSATSEPVEDIHYLIVLARLRAPRSTAITARTASALLALDRKLAERHLKRDRHWPLRIAELHVELARKDPALNAALLAHHEFGRADHALFALTPGFDRRRAAEVFLERGRHQAEYPWNAALVEILSALPEQQTLPVFRSLWGKAGLDAVLLPSLARHPEADDRDKFIQGLASPQLPLIRLSLEALQKLPPRQEGTEMLALIRALGCLPESSEGKHLRRVIIGYLIQITGQKRLGTDRQAWTAWFCKTYPDLAVRLTNPDGVDVAAWDRRMAKLDWTGGDAQRGQVVFTKASCAACHSGAQALGPDLNGVGGRFSRADLFTAIVQPSRDISPRYQTTAIETTGGKIYQGLIIYEAVDGMILQTGPATTVRLGGEQIASRRFTPTSLMPAGLLDPLSDQEIADLYAYLKGLGTRTTRK
jgi:putative heme-binding domain-containing protein